VPRCEDDVRSAFRDREVTEGRLLAEPLTGQQPGRLLWAMRGPAGVAEYFLTEYRGRWTPGGVLHSPSKLSGKWYGRRSCEWLQGRCWSAYSDPGETDQLQALWEKSGREDRTVFAWLNSRYKEMVRLAAEIGPSAEADAEAGQGL
jgi:hypothetical protein